MTNEELLEWLRATSSRCFRLHHRIYGAAYGKNGVILSESEREASVAFGDAGMALQRAYHAVSAAENGEAIRRSLKGES